MAKILVIDDAYPRNFIDVAPCTSSAEEGGDLDGIAHPVHYRAPVRPSIPQGERVRVDR